MRTRLTALVVALSALFVATGAVATGTASAQTSARAVVVVDFGSLGGGVHTSVIEFSGSVSGLEALQLAGASPSTITYGPLGQAVCQLFGAGDQPVPGQCPGGWVYFRAAGGAGGWSQSSLGASNTAVHDGDVEGWRYGGGAPPFQSFCSVAGCAPTPAPESAAPTATPTAPNGGGTGTDGGVSMAGAAGGDTTTGTVPGTPVASSTDPTATGNASGATTTSRPPERSSASVDHRVGRTVAAGAGTVSTGGGGGSPVGVIVAALVVAALAGGGYALRRRRTA